MSLVLLAPLAVHGVPAVAMVPTFVEVPSVARVSAVGGDPFVVVLLLKSSSLLLSLSSFQVSFDGIPALAGVTTEM